MTHSAEAVVRVKASLLRRRFAALTRIIRFRDLGIYRSVPGRVPSPNLVQIAQCLGVVGPDWT
jgi:hypothetical protein